VRLDHLLNLRKTSLLQTFNLRKLILVMYLGPFSIALLLIPTLLPIIYNFWKKKPMKPVLLIYLCCIATVISYPIVSYVTNFDFAYYVVSKFLLFAVYPVVTIIYLERWKLKEIFYKLGVNRKNLKKSILYGFVALLVTGFFAYISLEQGYYEGFKSVLLFLEAFNEEFFFRGFLFLYLMTKTDFKISYVTSVLGFILIHPQHFDRLFILSTISQAILMTYITGKTKNIIGPWFSHGLNRFIPGLIKLVI